LPPYSTLRTFIQALEDGNTNITRVLTILMHYPSRWQPNVADITVDPLSPFLKDLFSAPGMMKPIEIEHIEDAWPMEQKEELRDNVLQAIEIGRRMVFKWMLKKDPPAETEIVWPPDSAPLTVPIVVTFRSPRPGVQFSGEEGSEDDVIVTT
jgi:hypothetical protein